MTVDLNTVETCINCGDTFGKTLHPNQNVCGLCIAYAEFRRFLAQMMYMRWGVLPYDEH